ncbi:MAG TPA: hypothetical protein VK116_02110 [Planctomycetota bacterium]|nr:hypothetical protein [Planctomycetota bacterium]
MATDVLTPDRETETAIDDEERERPDYWAQDEDRFVVQKVLERKESQERDFARTSIFTRIARSIAYWSGYFDGWGDWGDTAIKVTGEHGQILEFNVNMYRYLGLQLKTLITADRPRYNVTPANVEVKARTQARLGTRVLDYYLNHGVEDVIRQAVEDALVNSVGFVQVTWDASLGAVVDADEESSELEYEGDVSVRAVHLLDIVFDYRNKDRWEDVSWCATRSLRNKYDLIARFPDKREEILSAANYLLEREEADNLDYDGRPEEAEDEVEVWEFFHKKTDAIPVGRYILFVGEEPLIDMDLPYKEIPVYPIWSGHAAKSIFGHSPLFDIQKQQEYLNELLGKLATIHDTLGLPILWTKSGTKQPHPSLWLGAIAWLESEEKPEVVTLSQVPKDVFETISMLVGSMEKQMAISPVVQGGAEGSQRANSMQRFAMEQALRFHSDLQAEYYRLFAKIGSAILEIFQRFASTERVISILGVRGQNQLETYTGDDLYDVTSVVVEPQSAMTRTIDGRIELLQVLAQHQVPLPKEELVAILGGAPLSAMTEGVEGEAEVVAAENETLLSGGPHYALATDNHIFHVKKHAAVLTTPAARNDPNLSKAVLAAIMEHLQLAFGNPGIQQIQAALGYLPPGLAIGPPPAPASAGGGPQAPGGEPPPPGGAPSEAPPPAPPEGPPPPA